MADTLGRWSRIKRTIRRMLGASSDFRMRSGSSSRRSNELRKADISAPVERHNIRGDLGPAQSVTAYILKDYLSSPDTSLQSNDSSRPPRSVAGRANEFASSEPKLHAVSTEEALNFYGYTQETGVVKKQEVSINIAQIEPESYKLTVGQTTAKASDYAQRRKSDSPSRSSIGNQQLDKEAIKSVENQSPSSASADRYLLLPTIYVPPGDGVKRLESTHRQENRAIPDAIVSQAATTIVDANTYQPPPISSKRLGLSLERSAALRKTPMPEVSDGQLKKYEAVHISSGVADRRDSIRLQRSRRSLKLTNSDGSPNQYDGTSKGKIPQKVFEGAVKRQGFDPSDPADVGALVQKRNEERAPFTRAEKQASELGKQAARRGYKERERDSRSILDLP